jgi:putative ABC transport system permease protein
MIPLQLALRDWLDEWPTSICLAIGVAAAAIPLLLLLSIRTGIISQLRGELERFPSSRELITTGQPVVRWDMVKRLADRPDVGFVAPLTRLLSASAVLRTETADAAMEIDLVPSGKGDPLLPAPWRPGGLVLPEVVAKELGVGTGDHIRLILNRTTAQGKAERVGLSLPIHGIVPGAISTSSRRMALVDRNLLLASEIWREDATVSSFTEAWARARRDYQSRNYAGLRLYAASVDDVELIRALLLQSGMEAESHIDEIRLVRQLDHGLSIFLLVIGSITALGLCLSLAAAQWGWVERKRVDLSYLRLIGLGGLSIALIPLWESMLTVCAGLAIAGVLAWIAHRLINTLFAGQLAAVKDVSIFDPGEILWVALLALAAGGIAAVLAAINAQRITPITALRGN